MIIWIHGPNKMSLTWKYNWTNSYVHYNNHTIIKLLQCKSNAMCCYMFLSGFMSNGRLASYIKITTNSSAIDVISLLHVVMALLCPVACVSASWSSSIFSLLDAIILSPPSNAVNIFAGADLVCFLLSPHETFSECNNTFMQLTK